MIYDCIVLGVGGIGSAALYAAAKRGWRTLGIERFGVAHDRGSSHGRTRIIRTAYFEDPAYVPLAQKSWAAWNELQSLSQVKLVQKTGLLQVGRMDGAVLSGLTAAANEYDLAVESLSVEEAMSRYPAFKLDPEHSCIYEQSAGFLQVENCVTQVVKLAKNAGAEFLANTAVQSVSVGPGGTIKLQAGEGAEEFLTERLIVSAGAWAPDMLQSVPFDIQVSRQQQQWFQLDRVDVKYRNGFPAFLVDDDNGCFYGFPEIDYLGVKVAEHGGGAPVAIPSDLDRQCDPEDLGRAEAFLDRRFNFTRRRHVHHSVCMYSNSRDGHFVIDHHPESNRIVFAAGLSGHGFKFAPIIGQHMVDLLDEKPDPMFEFLQIGDRQLTGEFPV